MKHSVRGGLWFALSLALACADAAPATPVSTATAQSIAWPEQIIATGAVAAWQEAAVSNRVPGVAVMEIEVAVGDQVRKGALLARLDDRALLADWQRADGERERARIALQQAEREAERSLSLHSTGSVSEQELLAANTTRDLARAQLQVTEANSRMLRIKLDDSRLLAPDDGLITARSAVIGQVPAQGAELFRLIRKNRLEWRAELPPEQFARLRLGATVQLQLPDGQRARGRLRQLAGALENSSRMGLAFVDVLPGSTAKAGMLAQGRFELAPRAGIAVPAAAVQVRDGHALVYRIVQGQARQVLVQLGRHDGPLVEVQGELKAGERVVVQGAGFLRDGEPVSDTGRELEPSRRAQP